MTAHVYEVRPRKNRRGFDLIFRSAAVRSLVIWWPQPISNAVNYAKFYSCSYDAVIRVYDAAGNLDRNA